MMTRHVKGPIAVTVGLLMVIATLSTIPCMVLGDRLDDDPPPAVEIVLEDTYAEVNLSDLTGSHEVELNGYVQTNYPGLMVQVLLDAACSPHWTAVEPNEMVLVGKQFVPFKIKVDILTVTNNNTTYMGTFHGSATIQYPGGQKIMTWIGHFSVTVEGNGKDSPKPFGFEDGLTRSAPQTRAESQTLYWVVTILVLTLIVVLMYVGKLRPRKRKKMRRKAS